MRTAAVVLVAGWALQATPAVSPLAVAAEARAVQPGELVVLTITAEAPIDSLHARVFQRAWSPFQVDARTWRVLIGIDLTTKPGEYPVAINTTGRGGARSTSYTLAVADKAFPTRTLSVDDAFVNPPASATARIEDDAKALERCWANPSPRKLWDGAFVRPVPHDANSAFGSRSVFNGQARNPHTGADFRSPAGTPIKAPNAGRVALSRNLYYSGNTVVIDHGLGLFSLFAHLAAIDVKDGAMVATGDVLGKVGATGRVTGAHLHWMVRVNGARVDPISVLQVLGRQ